VRHRGGIGQGSRWQGSPRHVIDDEEVEAMVVAAEKGSSRWCGLGGEDEVGLWVACELRGVSGELLGMEVEAEGP
jgi:hypothetical protein